VLLHVGDDVADAVDVAPVKVRRHLDAIVVRVVVVRVAEQRKRLIGGRSCTRRHIVAHVPIVACAVGRE
jgi:hypothetical protein